jgi:hypothetical protein
VSGPIIVVGAPFSDQRAGRAYVFRKTSGRWKQVAELKGSDTTTGDYFGLSVAVSGATIVVGAFGHEQAHGRAYVFADTESGWRQSAELSADTVEPAGFGVSVGILRSTVVVGAALEGSGRAYVFAKTRAGWHRVIVLRALGTVSGDELGSSVAIAGSTIVVGAEDRANLAGGAYVFTDTTSGWRQSGDLSGSDTVAGDELGYSVATSGSTIVVGAFRSRRRRGAGLCLHALAHWLATGRRTGGF